MTTRRHFLLGLAAVVGFRRAPSFPVPDFASGGVLPERSPFLIGEQCCEAFYEFNTGTAAHPVWIPIRGVSARHTARLW